MVDYRSVAALRRSRIGRVLAVRIGVMPRIPGIEQYRGNPPTMGSEALYGTGFVDYRSGLSIAGTTLR